MGPRLTQLCERYLDGYLNAHDFRLAFMSTIAGLDMDQDDTQTVIIAIRLLKLEPSSPRASGAVRKLLLAREVQNDLG